MLPLPGEVSTQTAVTLPDGPVRPLDLDNFDLIMLSRPPRPMADEGREASSPSTSLPAGVAAGATGWAFDAAYSRADAGDTEEGERGAAKYSDGAKMPAHLTRPS